MAIDFCNLCSDPCIINGVVGNNSMQEIWRSVVAQSLCRLASSTPPVGGSTQLEQVALDAATLQTSYGSYADPGFLDSALKLSRLTAVNTSDSDIEISLNGGTTTHFKVLAKTTRDLPVGVQNFSAVSDFMVRKAAGMTASNGSFYLEGGY